MECLTPTVSFDLFMDVYFTSFRLLTHLGINNIRVTGVLNKNRLRKYTIIRDKQMQKRERGYLEQCIAHQAKTLCKLCGWLERQQGAVLSFFWIVLTLHKLVQRWNKVERKYDQEKQPNQFHWYIQNVGFVKRMGQNVAKYRIGVRMKKMVVVPVCLLYILCVGIVLY